MKDNLSRLLLALAATDIPEAQLHELLIELSALTSKQLGSRISDLRRLSSYTFQEFDTPNSVRNRLNEQRSDLSVGARVDQLLRGEAKLSTGDAVQSLSSRIVQMKLLTPDRLPPLSRKSLRDWVGRLAMLVQPKDILRVATIVRNERVHSPARDWRLREDS
jgi:hypothetical protein